MEEIPSNQKPRLPERSLRCDHRLLHCERQRCSCESACGVWVGSGVWLWLNSVYLDTAFSQRRAGLKGS